MAAPDDGGGEDPASHLVVTIPEVESHTHATGSIAMYRVEFRDNRTKESATTRHRFSDFVALDAALRRALANNHLFSNLPSLPPKRWRFLQDHTSGAFLEARRSDLEAYLRKVIHLPGIAKTGMVRTFLHGDGGG